jgi:hypothetical protein
MQREQPPAVSEVLDRPLPRGTRLCGIDLYGEMTRKLNPTAASARRERTVNVER